MADAALEKTLVGAPVQGARQLRWEMKTRAWLAVHPSIVNGTELGEEEWRDTIFLRYGL